jgi:integrase
MPRKLKDADLGNPTGRTRLKPRRKPYWRLVSGGQHIGYRRHLSSPHAGTWVARFYLGGERYAECVLGAADDALPADGIKVLDFRQAQDSARAWFVQQGRKAAGVDDALLEPYTVEHCLADYLAWYGANRKAPQATRHAVEAHILPALGAREVGTLTAAEIKRWLQGLAAARPRLRSAKDAEPKWREVTGPEGERKRKATANRILTILKAALNMAFADGRVPSDAAWRRVKAFKGADAPRISFLDHEQAGRLINSCDPDFARLVRAALCTGCRYGELVALKVSDYLPDVRAIHIAKSKGGRARQVYLGDEGLSLFHDLTAGRPAGETLFPRSDGLPWGAAHQTRRMRDACAAAGVRPAVSFHVLRHTYASHFLMGGGSLPGLASQLGHSDTRMTVRHYAHLADKWRAEEAREFAPAFGPGAAARSKVVRIAR